MASAQGSSADYAGASFVELRNHELQCELGDVFGPIRINRVAISGLASQKPVKSVIGDLLHLVAGKITDRSLQRDVRSIKASLRTIAQTKEMVEGLGLFMLIWPAICPAEKILRRGVAAIPKERSKSENVLASLSFVFSVIDASVIHISSLLRNKKILADFVRIHSGIGLSLCLRKGRIGNDTGSKGSQKSCEIEENAISPILALLGLVICLVCLITLET